jgi:hypothetical protein
MAAVIPFIPLIAAGVSAGGGYLAARQMSSQTPTQTPQGGALQSQVLGMIQQRLRTDPNLTGYEGTGVSNIAQAYRASKASTDNSLTARGLAGSPVAAAADVTRGTAEASDTANFRNSVPLLARQLQSGDLSQAGSVLGLTRGSQTDISYGGGPAGAATGLAGYLGYLSRQGAFKNLFGGAGAPGVNDQPTLAQMTGTSGGGY